MKSLFKITSVDLYDYNGRDFHPKGSDIGLIVAAVKMESIYYSPESCYEPVVDKDGNVHQESIPYLFGKVDESGHDGLETMYTCVTKDGRVLQMMDFEIEVVK